MFPKICNPTYLFYLRATNTFSLMFDLSYQIICNRNIPILMKHTSTSFTSLFFSAIFGFITSQACNYSLCNIFWRHIVCINSYCFEIKLIQKFQIQFYILLCAPGLKKRLPRPYNVCLEIRATLPRENVALQPLL